MTSYRRAPKPSLPGDDLARQAAFPKPSRVDPPPTADTRGLAYSKLHPQRDVDYLRWLTHEPCSIKGHPKHERCWNPQGRGRLNDPAHCGKSYSGRLKRSDAEAFTLCRLAHEEEERNADLFDKKYGINRFAIAAAQRAKYLAEKEGRR